MAEVNETPQNPEPSAAPEAASRPKRATSVATPPPPVKLEIYEGPLDLLLDLIRKQEINIYDIPIAQITREYLNYLRMLEEMNIDVAGEFIFMAATLIHIKSRMLLPRDPLAEDEELIDPRAELVDRLLEHQKFKAAAQMLWSRATVEQAVFTRAELETDKNNPEVAVGLFDLLRVFQEILARHKEEVRLEIEREEVTMAEMIERLRNMMRSAGEVNLLHFFQAAQTRRELVVAFLSVLELVRLSEISLLQSETFGEIMARATS